MPGIEKFRADTPEECEKIEVGDRVRSYDFEFRDDCYIEGTVTEIGVEMEGCPRYQIDGDLYVVEGKEHLLDRRYYPPVNGTRNLFGGYTNGVRKVG